MPPNERSVPLFPSPIVSIIEKTLGVDRSVLRVAQFFDNVEILNAEVVDRLYPQFELQFHEL